MNEITLYAKDSRQKIRIWKAWSEGNTIYWEYGALDGETIVDSEPVSYGLASRSLDEQIISRIDSRANKKRDTGYVESLQHAIDGIRLNRLGYKRAAKCSRYDNRQKYLVYDGKMEYFVQTKLDGHHMSVVNDNGKLIAYSTNGKIIDTIPEILNNLNVPIGRTIEGELYHHETPLQTISSWVKKRQPETLNLTYCVYDIDGDKCYRERFQDLCEIIPLSSDILPINSNVELHKTELYTFKNEVEMLGVLKTSIEDKYEGLVLRLPGYPHMDGRKSNGMIKVKPMYFDEFLIDDEFLVVDVLRSVDGWARLVCITENGKTFRCSAPGTVEQKTYILENKSVYIGKHVRVNFAGYTKKKIPFHPVAIMWREKFEE